MVPLQSLPNIAAAFKGGQVDGAVVPVTTYSQMEAGGGGKILACIGNEVPWQLGGVFASPKTIAERRPVIEKFLVGYRRGAAAYQEAFGKRENGNIDPGRTTTKCSASLPGAEAAGRSRCLRLALHRSRGAAGRRRYL